MEKEKTKVYQKVIKSDILITISHLSWGNKLIAQTYQLDFFHCTQTHQHCFMLYLELRKKYKFEMVFFQIYVYENNSSIDNLSRHYI